MGIHIYLFLTHFPLCHYIIPFLVTGKRFCIKDCLSNINRTILKLFFAVLCFKNIFLLISCTYAMYLDHIHSQLPSVSAQHSSIPLSLPCSSHNPLSPISAAPWTVDRPCTRLDSCCLEVPPPCPWPDDSTSQHSLPSSSFCLLSALSFHNAAWVLVGIPQMLCGGLSAQQLTLRPIVDWLLLSGLDLLAAAHCRNFADEGLRQHQCLLVWNVKISV